MKWDQVIFAAAGLALVASTSRAETVVLEPIRNNTLYEDGAGALSNGAGRHTFVGVTGVSRITRTLLAFDAAGSTPAGATITAARLTLNVSNPLPNAEETVTLHRVLADWGEGTSDAGQGGIGPSEGDGAPASAGDATWIHTFFDSDLWATPGGDFVAEPSASLGVGGNGSYTWGSTPEMAADVQSWLDDPDGNFGWIVLGQESRARTAKRLDSRHNGAAVRPRLEIEYEVSVTATATALPEDTLTPTAEATRTATPTSGTPAPRGCAGDCDGNAVVAINELITGVNIGLGTIPLDSCTVFDANGDGTVSINELILGVNNGQNGCPA